MNPVSRSLACFGFILSLFLPQNEGIAQKIQECSEIIVSSSVTDTVNGLNNGKVTVTAKGGEGPYYYVFYYGSGHPVTSETKTNTVTSLKAGTIYCSVVDANGCTGQIKITIK
jgi:hypothetical protein